MPSRRRLIAGNWKMNGLLADSRARVDALRNKASAAAAALPEIVLCPPFTLLAGIGQAIGASSLALGAQDCHVADKGAHTGDIAAPMLADIGCRYVIVGHSERRANHGESDALVRAKAEAAHRAGLVAIICVGESAEQRKAAQHLSVVAGQLEGSLPPGATAASTVVAYEPVWAIGTGLTPTADDIAEMHAHLRGRLKALSKEGEGIRVLYGGSANAGNAAALLATPGVDGLLVGGASLDAEAFWTMVQAAA
jgi:triosephosphate isomerase (TIM)